MKGEDPGMEFHDDTNVIHQWQGALRFAELDAGLIVRCEQDAGGEHKLVLTHCDQAEPKIFVKADLYAYGPTRATIRGWKERAKGSA